MSNAVQGAKTFHYHLVGDLTVSYEGLGLTADPGPSFLIYTAEPGSASQERLDPLASWTAMSRTAESDAADLGAPLDDTAGTTDSHLRNFTPGRAGAPVRIGPGEYARVR